MTHTPFTLIVLSSSSIPSGGARQALYLAQAFHARGYPVTFFSPPHASYRGLAPELHWQDLPTKLADINKALRAAMPAHQKTVVHAFHNKGVKTAAYLGTLWRLQKLPVACAAHRGMGVRPGNPLPYLLPGIRAYMVNSQVCAKSLPLLWRRHRCHVVHNAIPDARLEPSKSTAEVKQELQIPEDHLVIGCVCNNSPQKGAGVLMEAFALLKDKLPIPATLVIVGVKAQDWQPMAETLGISAQTRLVGMTENVANYLQAFSLVAFASYYVESQPNVILEAMLMGKPIVATNVGGVPDLLAAEYLVPPQDPQALADKILAMATTPEWLQRSASENLEKGQQFTIKAKVAHVLALYENILAELGN